MMEIRVGRIVAIEKHPNADSLFLESISVGRPQDLRVVSGLAKWYSPAQLLDTKVLVVCNMKPSKLRGEVSEAMLLAAALGEQVQVVQPQAEVNVGEPVSCAEYPASWEGLVLNSTKTRKILELLRTDSSGRVVWNGIPLLIQGLPIVSPLVNAQVS
jgi:methionine--tRNA ligase beta chain